MKDKLEFLKRVKPFGLLSDDVLAGVADLLKEVTYSKDTIIYHQEVTKLKGVDLIAEGSYETFFYDSSQNKRMVEICGENTCYGGVSVLLNKKRSIRTVIARKGTRVYFLHRHDFKGLCQGFDEFFHHFTADFGRRMLDDEFAHFVRRSNNTFEENYIASDQLYSRKVETMDYRSIIVCDRDTPVYEAADIMAKQKTSCIFVEGEQDEIIGYVTDITLRDNVIARRASPDQPIHQVMDNPIVSVNSQAYVYEAILLMFQSKIRYLLVEDNGHYVGMISRNKLLSEQAQSPFVFIQSVRLANSVEELKKKWEKVPQIVVQLLNRGVKSEIVNQVITTVSDAIALKVIEGVIKSIGEPPAKFVFMVLGSEGRKEQTLKTDQDNAIIYEDKANEQRERVRKYFLKFAEMVSERLDHIGFSFCEGGFMAKNPKWTHSLSHWKRNYQSWMDQSAAETMINFSTFFDCRFIYGERAIMDELREFLDSELQHPLEKVFYHMAVNALQYEPPLTFFKSIKTFTVGKQKVFNLKKAMTPIVDLVRVYALRNRIFATNTGERIETLYQAGVFTEREYHELIQSYYYLMGLRLKKQARQIIDDRASPDNYVDPNSLTKIEQVTLKEIFRTIQNFQLKIKVTFTKSVLG